MRTVIRVADRLLVGVVGIAVSLVFAGCATVSTVATPCPGLSGWPPPLPAPPADVLVTHPAGTIVRVTNGTGAPIKVRYRTWTPDDCDATTWEPGDGGSVLAPGKIAEWSGDVPAPARGTVLGGLEFWTHGCDEACGQPADAFVSFEITPTR